MRCSKCAFDLRIGDHVDVVPTIDGEDRQTVEVPAVCYTLKDGRCVPSLRFVRSVERDRERYRAGKMGWHDLLVESPLPVRHGAKVTPLHVPLPTSIECPLCHTENRLPIRA